MNHWRLSEPHVIAPSSLNRAAPRTSPPGASATIGEEMRRPANSRTLPQLVPVASCRESQPIGSNADDVTVEDATAPPLDAGVIDEDASESDANAMELSVDARLPEEDAAPVGMEVDRVDTSDADARAALGSTYDDGAFALSQSLIYIEDTLGKMARPT